MEDLTGRFMANLVPSSMQAGNTTADDPALAMTAPGSTSVLPVPEKLDVLPMPRFTNGTAIPVSHPGSREKVTAASARWGGATYSSITTGGDRWEQT